MFYIYACRRDDLTRYYWNRKSRLWCKALEAGCAYPTRRGVDRMHMIMAKDAALLGRRFHELGWKLWPA